MLPVQNTSSAGLCYHQVGIELNRLGFCWLITTRSSQPHKLWVARFNPASIGVYLSCWREHPRFIPAAWHISTNKLSSIDTAVVLILQECSYEFHEETLELSVSTHKEHSCSRKHQINVPSKQQFTGYINEINEMCAADEWKSLLKFNTSPILSHK